MQREARGRWELDRLCSLILVDAITQVEAELAESREAVNQMNTINSKVKTKAFMLEIFKILAILVFKRI